MIHSAQTTASGAAPPARRSAAPLPRVALPADLAAALTEGCWTAASLRAAAELSLPLLGKLVRWTGYAPPGHGQAVGPRLLACPAAALRQPEPSPLRDAFHQRLQRLDDDRPLWIVPESWWTGAAEPDTWVAEARAIGQWLPRLTSRRPLALLGLPPRTSHAPPLPAAAVVETCRAAGVALLAAGDDRQLHRQAADAGLATLAASATLPVAALCSSLLAFAELAHTGTLAAWEPHLPAPLNGPDLGPADAGGRDMLRAVALARLVLPPHVAVRVPLGPVEPKTACVAAEFGAGQWSWLAADAETSAALELPSAADLPELLEESPETLPFPSPERADRR